MLSPDAHDLVFKYIVPKYQIDKVLTAEPSPENQGSRD